MAGIPIPSYMDGRSLLPLLGANPPPATEWRQACLFEQYIGDHLREPDPLGEPPDPFDSARYDSVSFFYTGLRTAELKYIEYDTGERELYDLVNDPYELENQITNADPWMLAQLSQWLRMLHICAAADCRMHEMHLPLPLVVNTPTCDDLDFDASGGVTVMDVTLLAAHWGETAQMQNWDPRFDLDENLVVDTADLTIIAERWGEVCLLAR